MAISFLLKLRIVQSDVQTQAKGKPIMKKIFALCAAAALAISMAACSSSADSETSKPTGSDTTKPSTQETTQATTPPTTAPAFQDIVLAETDDVTVKITGVDEKGLLGYTLNVYLENNTELELMFTVENVSVNGYMVDPFWADTVDAGKKANETITFLKSEFEKNGIEKVEEITLTLRVYDNGDWMADDIFKDTVTIKF